jgi:tetratricopeptide (TPR) repeat protein
MPLRFLGIPGPKFGPAPQNVTVSHNFWQQFHSLVSRTEVSPAKKVAPKPVDLGNLLDQAKLQLTADISKSPQDPSLQNRLGIIFLQSGQNEKAKELFLKAKELARSGLFALHQTVAALKAQGKTKDASDALLALSAMKVELSAAHANLACVDEKLGDKQGIMQEQAEWSGEAGIDGITEPSKPTVAKNQTDAKKNPAKDSSVTATTLDTTVSDPNLLQAEKLLGANFFDQAISLLKSLTKEKPNFASAHAQLGIAYILTQNMALAIPELETACKLDPKNAANQNNLGLAYQALGEKVKAKSAFAKASAIDPKLSIALINLGNLCASSGELGQASSAYQSAIKYGSAKSHGENEETKQNVKGDALAATAHNNLAAIMASQGNTQAAIKEFQLAIADQPNMASAHYGLGMALTDKGAYLGAIGEFKKALAIDPQMTIAQNKIEIAARKAGLSQTGSN